MSISTTTVTIVSSNVGLNPDLWVRSFGLRVRIVGVYGLILEDGYYPQVVGACIDRKKISE